MREFFRIKFDYKGGGQHDYHHHRAEAAKKRLKRLYLLPKTRWNLVLQGGTLYRLSEDIGKILETAEGVDHSKEKKALRTNI